MKKLQGRGLENLYKIKVLILYKTATFLSCLRENLYRDL